MMLARATCLLLLPVTALGCAHRVPTGGGESSDGTRAEAEIRAALARWVDAANHQDWKTAAQVWAPDLVGWYPGGEDDTYRREVEGAAKASATPSKAPTTYELTINEVIVDHSLAVVRDTWVFHTPLPAGGEQLQTVRSFEIWREQPDRSWRISRWIDAPEKPHSP